MRKWDGDICRGHEGLMHMLQVLTCYGNSEKAALLSHLTVSDTLRLILVSLSNPHSACIFALSNR